MNRRHFIKCGMAAGVAIALGRKVARAVSYTDQRYWVGRIPQIGDPHPPIDVTGKPTPDWLHKGRAGQTYFLAGTAEGAKVSKCLLNGVDVSMRAKECDTQGGWVRMYDVDANGEFTLTHIKSGDPQNSSDGYWYYPDWSNRIPAGYTLASVERIHFGKVEIR